MNFDHVAPTVFWPLLALFWLIASIVVGLLIGRIIRWCDQPQPRNHYVDRVDLPRCERAGSQGENQRRINTWSGR